MAAGERLIALIAAADEVRRLREIAGAIRQNGIFMARYGDLLALQKRIVSAEARGEGKRAALLRKEYETALSGFSDVPAIAEYLTLLEELDAAVQEAVGIINDGIARD